MNLRLVLGIILPLIIVITLVVLSTSDTGFYVTEKTVDSVPASSVIFPNTDYSNNGKKVLLQEITITNDFFLPRSFDLKDLVVCMNDKEDKSSKTSMSAYYSLSRDLSSSIYDERIQIPAHSEKKLFVYAQSYNYGNTDYYVYDEILLVKYSKSKYNYHSCYDLEQKDLDSAVHIAINKS